MYKKTIFDNGLRLLTVPQKGTKAVTIFVLFGVGSRFETIDIQGVSHFVEHMMFKGTKRRPTTLDISKALDSVGAEYNAATAKDWTGYYIKIDSQKIELALDVLSDMLYFSKFETAEINKERKVIIEEINMYNDNPMMHIEDILETIMFSGNTLGREIAGPKKIIATVSPRKIVDYKNKFYVPQNTVISIAGKIDNKIVPLVKKYFQTKKSTLTFDDSYQKFENKQKESKVKIKYQNTAQVQLALGFPAYPYSDDKMYAAYLLSIILGGNMSSRLFINVREKKGLAYFVRSYVNIYKDTGGFVVQAGLDKSRIFQAIEVILAELKKIKKDAVTNYELSKAKEFLRGKLILTLENSSNLSDWYAKQELLQETVLTPEQRINKFNKVSVKQIHQVAQEMFQNQKACLAMIGPFKNSAKFKSLFDEK